MRMGVGRVGCGALLLAVSALGQLPPLPKWSPSDFERLEKGELVPGADFWPEGWDLSLIHI